MERCKTCKWWKRGSWNAKSGECRIINNTETPDDFGGDQSMAIVVSDDMMCSAWAFTRPNFGCVLHEPKSSAA